MKETNQNTLSGGLNPELTENTNDQPCSCGSGEPENECCEITSQHIFNELQSMDIDWLFELDDFISFIKEQKKSEKTKDEYEWEEIVGDYLYSVQQKLYQEDSSQGQWIDRYDLYDEIKELFDERVYDEIKEQSKIVLDCLDRGGEKKEKPIDTITTSIERTRELFEITERRNQKIIQDWSSLIENHEDNYEYLHKCLIQYRNVVELGFEGNLVECNTLIEHLEEMMKCYNWYIIWEQVRELNGNIFNYERNDVLLKSLLSDDIREELQHQFQEFEKDYKVSNSDGDDYHYTNEIELIQGFLEDQIQNGGLSFWLDNELNSVQTS